MSITDRQTWNHAAWLHKDGTPCPEQHPSTPPFPSYTTPAALWWCTTHQQHVAREDYISLLRSFADTSKVES